MIPAKSIEEYLHAHIPLSKAMGVRVQTASMDSVELSAPLEPNINHEETVFGGSASAVAILSAWALVYIRVKSEGVNSRIVIHRNTMLYQKPIGAGFTATASMPGAAAWSPLFAALNRKRMARISIPSILHCEGEEVGKLEGEFVVLPAAA